MIVRSLRARIGLILVGSLLLALLATFLAALTTTRNAVLAHAGEQLDVGTRVFQRLVGQRASQLAAAAQVLAADFGFKQAVATGERATVGLALLNHGARIGAGFAALLDNDGQLLADSGSSPQHVLALPELLPQARLEGTATGVVMIDGAPQQMVLVPVHAPVRIGWVALGFAVDQRFAEEMRDLTGLQVTFLGGVLPVSTLSAAAARGLTATPDMPASELVIDNQRFLRRDLRLVGGPAPVDVVLLADQRQALSPFLEMRRQLLIIAVFALVLALVGAFVLARSVTRPLQALAAAAERIGHGDFGVAIDTRGNDELGTLARSLAHMQGAIAERESRIEHQAFHDELTGLPNRASAIAALEQRLLSVAPESPVFAVLLLDGNRFKEINDTLGHSVGDQVLIALGQRLRHGVQHTDLVARLGGDEFLLVLDVADEDAALAAASRITMGAAEPVRVNDMTLHLDVSIGVAVFPQHGTDPQTLLRRADIAMYEAKLSHEAVRLYSAGEDAAHLRRLMLINELRAALGSDEMELHYQPQLDLADGQVRQVEALLRWEQPGRGPVSPAEFIPLAEHSGLIHPLTHWVLERALSQAARWREAGLDIAVAVNISAVSLMDRSIPGMLRSMLSAHRLPPQALIVEITESAVMRDAGRAIRVLERLRDLGLRLSIDDFGTGQSSLSQLHALPLHEIKIDRSFITRIHQSTGDAAIVRSIIELGHGMGLRVVAEGVEDERSRALLADFGCDLAQGYLIARPMPAADLAAWLAVAAHQAAPLDT